MPWGSQERTANPIRGRTAVLNFRRTIFALTCALGVVSGVTRSFQFGTNWPGFIQRAGNLSGPLLGYEVLTAFFIEATFLAIMLFGKDRVSNRVHLIAAALVARRQDARVGFR